MTTSDDRAYVWVWLPGQTEPVAAGLLQHEQGGYWFLYGRRYLERDDAISLLPLVDRQYLWGRQFLNPFSLEGY